MYIEIWVSVLKTEISLKKIRTRNLNIPRYLPGTRGNPLYSFGVTGPEGRRDIGPVESKQILWPQDTFRKDKLFLQKDILFLYLYWLHQVWWVECLT